MGVPFFEHWFSIEIRRNRLSYMLGAIALLVTFAVCLAVWTWFAETRSGRSLGVLIFTVPTVICGYMLTAQRLRDLNISGWLALLWIPINMVEGKLGAALTTAIVIILCAAPGTRGDNKYGPDPLSLDSI